MHRLPYVATFSQIALLAACHSSVGSPQTVSTSCSTLAGCCGSLGEGAQSCLATATTGDETSCSAALASYAVLGTCGGTAGTGPGAAGCASLLVCCAEMTGLNATGCNAVAATGVTTSCAAQLTVYTSTGACGGTPPGSGPGGGSSGITTGMSGSFGSGGSVGSTGGTTGPGMGSSQSTGTTGTGPGTGSTGGTSSGSSGSSGTTLPDGGGVPVCNLPSSFPSGGSCVSVVTANDAGTGIQCNPVTNAPCAAGSACDIAGDGTGSVTGFQCYPPPPPNTVAVCGSCDSSSALCVGGATCLGTTNTCAHYCCTNADCGSGTCSTGGFAPASSAIGVCVMP